LTPQAAWHDRYDRHAAGYARELDPTFAGSVERVVELAAARRGVQLLDLATGTGAIAHLAAARGASVVGVDASTGMLEVARTRSPGLDLSLANAYALPFADGAFDVVTCGLALSHFAERDRALAEVLRILRPGGMLVASAWAEGSSFPTTGVGDILDRYAGHAPTTVDEETWADRRRGHTVLREAGFANDHAGLVWVWRALGYGVANSRDQMEAWAQASERCVSHARVAGWPKGDSFGVAAALVWGPRPADEALRTLDDLADELGSAAYDLKRAYLMAALGRFEDAWALAAPAAERLQESADARALEWPFHIAALEGDYERAVQYGREVLNLVTERGLVAFRSYYGVELGRYLCRLGRVEEAAPYAASRAT
jgi:SAM-dependent methyltransferase